MRSTVTVAAVALAAATAPTPLAAQIIKGIVRDAATGQPVADASVVLLDRGGRIQRGTLTEADGLYALVCPKEGSYTLRVWGPGLSTWDSPPIEVGGTETVDFEIRVHREGAGVIEAFARRRESRDGIFLTAEDIERMNVERFSDIFRHLVAVRVIGLPDRPRPLAADNPNLPVDRHFTLRLGRPNYQPQPAGAGRRGEALGDCPPLLWVDGQWWGSIDEVSDTGPDVKLVPSEIAAIEVYSPPQVPSELNNGREAELCGVVSVWRK
jgi:hypothetical protein